MTLKGSYNPGQTPSERLRNKLHPVLRLIGIFENAQPTEEDIQTACKIANSTDVDEIIAYLEDCEALMYDEVEKPWKAG